MPTSGRQLSDLTQVNDLRDNDFFPLLRLSEPLPDDQNVIISGRRAKELLGDATGGVPGPSMTLYGGPGTHTDGAMHQKATTDLVADLSDDVLPRLTALEAGGGAGTVAKTGTVVNFTSASADYGQLSTGTFTTDVTGKVLGATSKIFLAAACTEPTLSPTDFQWLDGYFETGAAHLYMFSAGGNGKIQYLIQKL